MYGSLVLNASYRISGKILKRISLCSVHLISALARIPLRTYLGASRGMESKVKISIKVIYSSKKLGNESLSHCQLSKCRWPFYLLLSVPTPGNHQS